MYWLIFSALQLVQSFEKLNVHLIPHTHDDLGWLKTVDQYYYGDESQIAYAGVRYILTTVVQALQLDRSRKFTYVETGFFERWWREQEESTKSIVRQLVKEERLQFVGGGWVMNDEATCLYEDIIDQMALGLQYLEQELGVKPNVGWQIDPFGHSAGNADIFTKLGFDALFFWRFHYQDKEKRLQDKSMEMIWRPSISTAVPKDLFTHAFYHGYYYFDTFCLDVRCNDSPIMTDPRLEGYNLEERTDTFAQFSFEQAEYYRTNHILVPMGGDFSYQNAHANFMNMDPLVKRLNEKYGDKANFFYSTPNDYLKAVHSTNTTWPLKTDDFFPYADQPHTYWTGYFSSRPTFKYNVRTKGNVYRASESYLAHQALNHNIGKDELDHSLKLVNVLRKRLSVSQHHDAVTGTEKQAVTFDYAKMMEMGKNHTDFAMMPLINRQVFEMSGEKLNFEQCPLLNQTQCYSTQQLLDGNVVTLAIFNPNYYTANRLVQIPVPRSDVEVIDQDNNVIKVDIIENPYIGFDNSQNFTIYFNAQLSPMEVGLFKIKPGNGVALTKQNIGSDQMNFDYNILYYIGSAGDQLSKQTSGAYIFRPDGELTEDPIPYANLTSSYKYQGQVVDIICYEFEDKAITQFIAELQQPKPYLRVQTFINSVDIDDGYGKEIIAAYTSNDSSDKFLTDTNGMRMLERQWNYQPTYNLNYTTEPSSCNYYPITSAIGSSNFTVVVDRAHAATVRPTQSGQRVEVMVHRRLLHDDFKGVDQALNETDPENPNVGLRVVYQQLVLISQSEIEQRQAENVFQSPLQLYFSIGGENEFEVVDKENPVVDYGEEWNIRAMAINDKEFYLRIQNRNINQAEFDIGKFTSSYGIKFYHLYELSLGNNLTREEVVEKHYKWKVEGEKNQEEWKFDWNFSPQEVRSFKLVLAQ